MSVSADKTIKLWDSRESKPCVKTEKCKEEILNLCFQPELGGEKVFAISTIKDEVSFYDMRNWKAFKTHKFKNQINEFTWDRTGHLFFVTDSTGIISVSFPLTPSLGL